MPTTTDDPLLEDERTVTPAGVRRRVDQIRAVLGGVTDAEFAKIIGVDPDSLATRLLASERLPPDGWEPDASNLRRRVDKLREELGMLTEKEAEGIIGIEARTLQARRLAGMDIPAPIKVGRHIVYMLAEVERWLVARMKNGGEPEGASEQEESVQSAA